MNFYQKDCYKKFQMLPLELQQAFSSKEVLQKLSQMKEKYGVDFEFVVILIAIGEINPEQLKEYLEKKYKFSGDKLEKIYNEIVDGILGSAVQGISTEQDIEVAVKPEDLVSHSRQVLIKIREDLLRLLRGDARGDLDFINAVLIYQLANDDPYKTGLIGALYDNSESIGDVRLKIDGKEVEPTVGNWIKVFVESVEADSFSKLDINNFVTNFSTANNLAKDDKLILLKVLKFYYNVKFFPDSLEGDNADYWEILPNDKEEFEVSMPKIKPIFANSDHKISKDAIDYIQKSLPKNNKADNYRQDGSKKQIYPPKKIVTEVADEKIIKNPLFVNFELGQQEIEIAGQKFKPTLKKWLVKYAEFCEGKKGNLNLRVSFLNSPSVSSKLNVAQKEKLGLILKSYDEGVVLEFDFNEGVDVGFPKKAVGLDDLAAAGKYDYGPIKKASEVSSYSSKNKTNVELTEILAELDKEIELRAQKNNQVVAQDDLSHILKELKIKFDKQEKKNRFKKILDTRIRGIRDKVKFRQALQKEWQFGGMGFDEKIADKVINQTEKLLNGREKTSGNKSKLAVEGENKDIKDFSVSSDKKNINKPDRPKLKHRANKLPRDKKDDLSISSKSDKIRDISPTQKVVGPIDELKILNLDSFRKLSDTARGRVDKIEQRFEVLAKDSLLKKSEGIDAWKRSEVYRLYQKIGQESLTEAIPINQVIAKRKRENKPYLTQEEFDYIRDLNKNLRF